MNDTMSLAEREQQIYAKISKKLLDTGEKERLKEWLLSVLEECGWKDQVKKDCLQYAKENGISSKSEASSSTPKKPEEGKNPSPKDVNLDAMLKELTSKSKDAIPLHIKIELLNRMRSFFQSKEASVSASVSPAPGSHL